MALEQILRLGTHAEAEFLRKLPDRFDCLMLNANLVAATPAASAALVYSLNRPYAIDPFTHAFMLPHRFLSTKSKDKTAAARPKRSFANLAGAYFGTSEFVGKRSLSLEDIDVAELAQRTINYQRSWYIEPTKGDDFIQAASHMAPRYIFAPYFVLDRNLEFLNLNIALLAESLAIEPAVAAIIPLSRRAFENRDSILQQYVATGVRKIFLWIENFDEDAAGEADLGRYIEMVRSLAQQEIAVYNLFGGFFSCIAASYGLSGFAHGLVYGENKSFTPVVGGGQPPPRYYMKPRHMTMGVSESERLLFDVTAPNYLKSVCNCQICSGFIQNRGMPEALGAFSELNEENKFSPRAYAACRFHFLLARRDEVNTFPKLDAESKREYLQRNISFLDSLDAEELTGHLRTWITFV